MSAPINPTQRSSANPINASSVSDTLKPLGLSIKPEEEEHYTTFLSGMWEEWHRVDQMEDYVPSVDTDRFPRENVHRPTEDENPANAWAWKATIKDHSPNEGLLKGKTVALKDNIAVAGVPCLVGTNAIKDWVPTVDATVVTRILESGGIVQGKAVCENLCLWGLSDSSSTGPINNPYAEGYSAGGSSSGCGVLIARGDVDLAIGGDQGGSIRIPASKSGIVGLKPTHGLVPYTGIVGLEPTIDHTGPMSRTVMENALLLQVIAGADDIDDRQGPGCPFPGLVPDYPALAKRGVKNLRVGLLKEGFNSPLSDKSISDLVRHAASRLADLGATVSEISVPMHSDAPTLWQVVGRIGGSNGATGRGSGRKQLAMNDLTEKSVPVSQQSFDDMFVSTKHMIVNGEYAWQHHPGLYGKGTNLVRKLRNEYDQALKEVDVLLMPTLPQLPQKHVQKGASLDEVMRSGVGVTLNTSPFNLTGHPALSIPVGFLPNDAGVKLPVGMQLVGRRWDEGTVYAVGHAWELSTDWKKPPTDWRK